MKPDLYDDIVRTIKNFRGLSKDCAKLLIDKYNNVSAHTLYSILASEVQDIVRSRYYRIFTPSTDYYDIYLQCRQENSAPGILLKIAENQEIPPALLARHVLEKFYESKEQTEVTPDLSHQLKDTTLIEDPEMAREIFLCVLYDNQYGPISDAIRTSIGLECELKLKNSLAKFNIAFIDEEYLRSRGYDKTPDVKLEVPIAVNGFVVNWIESKGRFSSKKIHDKYVKEQLSSYWNRFGSGLVIYWFGFLDNLVQSSEKRFIVMDHFPEEIMYMNPSLIASNFM